LVNIFVIFITSLAPQGLLPLTLCLGLANALRRQLGQGAVGRPLPAVAIPAHPAPLPAPQVDLYAPPCPFGPRRAAWNAAYIA
jgi:hypothetical protein